MGRVEGEGIFRCGIGAYAGVCSFRQLPIILGEWAIVRELGGAPAAVHATPSDEAAKAYESTS